MQTVDIPLGNRSYPVYLGQRLLDNSGLWQRHLDTGKTLIVSNDVVAPHYLDRVTTALGDRDFDTLILPDGEEHKTLYSWKHIIDQLIKMGARRDCNVIALGGGVIGDVTGFAAASFMRGIRFIQAPTTLLAQVDASVGGKTAINHLSGKNLVGAFHQPAAVIMDLDTLNTLPPREFNAGMAEVIKYGAIRDHGFLDWLEKNATAIKSRLPDTLLPAVERSVSNKADIVAADEKEAGIRALLNFGHSFAHAIETVTHYIRFLHGEAVAIGMVVAATLSEMRGLCPMGSAQRLENLLAGFELPTRIPAEISISSLYDAMALDKKAVASGLRLILLKQMGEAIIDAESSEADIVTAMEHCKE